jgi:cytidyltransferase-like protein
MRRIAVVPGSFDPVTLGHLDVIERAAGIFDELHVLVVHNPGKTALLPVAQRITLLEKSIADAGLPGNITGDLVDGRPARRLLHGCRRERAREGRAFAGWMSPTRRPWRS